MRKLSEGEVLSLTGLLKMEDDGLEVAKAMKVLVSDEGLKSQVEAGILASEGRIKGLQQFVNENKVVVEGEVR